MIDFFYGVYRLAKGRRKKRLFTERVSFSFDFNFLTKSEDLPSFFSQFDIDGAKLMLIAFHFVCFCYCSRAEAVKMSSYGRGLDGMMKSGVVAVHR